MIALGLIARRGGSFILQIHMGKSRDGCIIAWHQRTAITGLLPTKESLNALRCAECHGRILRRFSLLSAHLTADCDTNVLL
jgi:hypothetical protein